MVGVRSADDEPVAVLQGYGFDLTWQQLNEAAIAIHRGAYWVATNTDSTRPTDRGLVPGNGAAVAAVAAAVAVEPEVAGKPYRPLMDETVARLGAARPIFVGDRLDTDIAGAVGAGLDSMLVLSGSHGARDLLAAGPTERPTHLGPGSARAAGAAAGRFGPAPMASAVGRRRAWTDGADVLVSGVDPDGLDAVWAAAHAAWAAADQGRRIDPVIKPVAPR